MTAMLIRESLAFEGDQKELEQLYTFDQLAQTAASTLGYKVLRDQLPKLRMEAEERVSLKKAMSDLGIEPYSAKAVKQYQSEMARRATPLATKATALAIVAVLLLFWGAGVTFLFSLIACIVCGVSEALAVPTWLAATAWFSLGGTVATFLVIGFSGERKLTYAEWTPIPISTYLRPVPEFALQTAVDLKETCPEAVFFIEELQLKERTLDPFLVVHDSNGNKYYLEVWNEPGFVQKR